MMLIADVNNWFTGWRLF